MHEYMHAWIQYMHAWIYIPWWYICICIYTCMYLCMYVYIYIYSPMIIGMYECACVNACVTSLSVYNVLHMYICIILFYYTLNTKVPFLMTKNMHTCTNTWNVNIYSVWVYLCVNAQPQCVSIHGPCLVSIYIQNHVYTHTFTYTVCLL
jgi:hypothetical protein